MVGRQLAVQVFISQCDFLPGYTSNKKIPYRRAACNKLVMVTIDSGCWKCVIETDFYTALIITL